MKQGGHYLLLSLLLSFLYNAHVEVRAIVTLDRVKSVVHHVEVHFGRILISPLPIFTLLLGKGV